MTQRPYSEANRINSSSSSSSSSSRRRSRSSSIRGSDPDTRMSSNRSSDGSNRNAGTSPSRVPRPLFDLPFALTDDPLQQQQQPQQQLQLLQLLPSSRPSGVSSLAAAAAACALIPASSSPKETGDSGMSPSAANTSDSAAATAGAGAGERDSQGPLLRLAKTHSTESCSGGGCEIVLYRGSTLVVYHRQHQRAGAKILLPEEQLALLSQYVSCLLLLHLLLLLLLLLLGTVGVVRSFCCWCCCDLCGCDFLKWGMGVLRLLLVVVVVVVIFLQETEELLFLLVFLQPHYQMRLMRSIGRSFIVRLRGPDVLPHAAGTISEIKAAATAAAATAGRDSRAWCL